VNVPWRPPRLVDGRPEVILTPRLADVLSGLVCGHSTAEIARRLYLGENTVKTHTKRLIRVFNARTRGHVAALAMSGQVQVTVADPAAATEWGTP
jgi:DNA-binding NarL/FixJ family response regulator